MLKEIIVSVDEYETRVALLEDKALVEIYREPRGEHRILRNIYKGRVSSILPGIQVAFVDIGMDRNAFLHVSDVYQHPPRDEEWDHEDPEIASDTDTMPPNVARPSVEELLHKNQEILVQIHKESIGKKGPRVTAHLTLPGRYLVFMPTLENIGVSRRIETPEERQRLKELVQQIRPEPLGFIIRTAAEGKGEKEFQREIKFLMQDWNQITEKAQSVSAPALIHEDLSLLFRTIRDLFTEDVAELVIDSREAHKQIMDYLEDILPHLKQKVRHYTRKEPIFEHYNIEKEIKRALKQKIWLKCGGHIVIDQTEAMVAIDVNTGKYVGKADPDDTILKTNLEAVEEITRQIRLRDIGGIIILDLIDMDEQKHKKQVLEALEQALKRDRARTNIIEFTELGLVEMTRQRSRPSLKTMLCQSCPYCNGSGSILSEETITTEIMRAIRKIASKVGDQGLKVIANEAIAIRLLEVDKERMKALAAKLDFPIEVEGDPDLHMEDYRILSLQNNQEVYLHY